MWFAVFYVVNLYNYIVTSAKSWLIMLFVFSDVFFFLLGGFYSLFFTVVCFLQGKEMKTCLLSDTQLSDTGPLILFLIDINSLRFAF